LGGAESDYGRLPRRSGGHKHRTVWLDPELPSTFDLMEHQLAQQDVVYLTQVLSSSGTGSSTTIFRGRLHQALSGNWVFNTSTGQNGVAGIDLGQPTANWTSSNTPVGGLLITITNPLASQVQTAGGLVDFAESITLTSVIPADLAD
jgi:hypothetical protein